MRTLPFVLLKTQVRMTLADRVETQRAANSLPLESPLIRKGRPGGPDRAHDQARFQRADRRLWSPVLSAGLVFLAVLSERFFGFRLGRRQWIGVIITAAGLAVIGLTQETPPGERPGYALAALIAVECTVFALAIALARISSRRRVLDAWQGIILGGIAGALFGVSDIALEFLTDAVEDGVLKLISPWTFAALAASVFAFYASARGLQLGPGVEVIALTSVAANLIAIIGGILVFRDSIGTEPVAIVGRMLAFGLVVAGAAMIPAPVRAAAPRDQRDTERSTDAERI